MPKSEDIIKSFSSYFSKPQMILYKIKKIFKVTRLSVAMVNPEGDEGGPYLPKLNCLNINQNIGIWQSKFTSLVLQVEALP